jgi:hypothetical protein
MRRHSLYSRSFTVHSKPNSGLGYFFDALPIIFRSKINCYKLPVEISNFRERTFHVNRQVSSNVVSRSFVESTNISPGPISVLLFAQLSGSSEITAEGEGRPSCDRIKRQRAKWAANRAAVAVCVFSQ